MSRVDGDRNSTSRKHTEIYAYLGVLTLVAGLGMPYGYLVDIASTFMLKNRLHASADTTSLFRILVDIPMFVSFMFGLARDRWSPFGLRDRGQLMIFGPAMGLIFIWLAFAELEFTTLTVGIFLAMAAYGMIGAAVGALTSLLGQENFMTGRLAVLSWVVVSIPNILSAWTAGWANAHLSPRDIFLIMAAIGFAIGAFGLWRSQAVSEKAYDAPAARTSDFWSDVNRLVRHRALYPAVLIYFMFSVGPGYQTPLQYYLTERLHLPDASYANFTAIGIFGFVPLVLLYGPLCKRFAVSKLLFWSTVVSIGQAVPMLFMRTETSVMVASLASAALGALATVAYSDLCYRACPSGLQGTLTSLAFGGGYAIATRCGDYVGARIYRADPAHGFLECVVVTCVIYALILPVLLLVPKGLIATRDGEENAAFLADAASTQKGTAGAASTADDAHESATAIT